MKFSVEKNLFNQFPGLHIGVLAVKEIDNRGLDEDILGLIRELQLRIREEFTIDTLLQHPKIAVWREAYSSFGAKPKKHPSSVESLYRMTLKGSDLRHINKVVDVYNGISLKHMVPVGGDDTARIEGDIRLTVARGGEPFRALHALKDEAACRGEVVYMDDREVLCRRWNWRECDKTKMTESTTEVVLVVEGLPPVTRMAVEAIVSDLKNLVMKSCGGKSRHAVLDGESPAFIL
ncbi:MAG: hypothetical protein JXB23_00865 [Candidatus Aminicenantes bacterium]|nr:hypothetical protein [Candidatus Aminicenantes bacterium]